MRFQDIELFVTVVEAGNFSSAARRMHLTQPAVSQVVANLEKELATVLLIREARQVVLTASGKVLYEQGLKLLADLEQIRQRIQEAASQPAGRLVLSAGEASGVYLAPFLLGGFKQRYPLVQPKLEVRLVDETIATVLEGRCHLGLAPVWPEDPRLEAIPLFTDELALIVPPSHPLADRGTIEPGELLGQPLLIREKAGRWASTLARALASVGISFADLSIFLEVDSQEGLKTGVTSGLGMGFISSTGLRPDDPGYRIVRVAGLDTRRSFNLIRRVAEPRSYVERLFWEYCQSETWREEMSRRGGGPMHRP